MPADIDHVIRELREDLRGVGKLRGVIEGLTSVMSDLRDELLRNRIVQEDLRDVMRELRDVIRHSTTKQLAMAGG